MSPESKLEAARAKGDLTGAIGALRDQARAELEAEPASPREQLGLEDASIRTAVGLAGTQGAERRQAMSAVQEGRTMTSKGVAKTVLTRAEKIARAEAWGQGLTQEQRDTFVASDKFYALPDAAAEILSEVFASLEDRAYEESIGIEAIGNYDFPSPEVDSIFEDDDGDEVADDSDDYEATFDGAGWEAEA